jgi:hypothetical protein
MGVLGPWGLSESAEILYRAMLREPQAVVEDVAARLGWDPALTATAVDELVTLGLGTTDDVSGMTVVAPGTVVTALLSSAQREIDDRRLQLDQLRSALPSLAADHLIGQASGWRQTPVARLQEHESFFVVEDFQRTTEGEVVSCHSVVDIDVDTDEYQELLLRQLAEGRPMRGLYPSDVVHDPARLEYVRYWAAAGEQVRLIREVPPQISAWGNEIAMLSSAWSGEPGSRLVVRAPEIVAVVRALFDQYWAAGLPLGKAARTSREADSEVLDLLALGAKDEDLARQLGVSLRTARRRVADTLADLGASTRFQAGREAARRGLV